MASAFFILYVLDILLRCDARVADVECFQARDRGAFAQNTRRSYKHTIGDFSSRMCSLMCVCVNFPLSRMKNRFKRGPSYRRLSRLMYVVRDS